MLLEPCINRFTDESRDGPARAPTHGPQTRELALAEVDVGPLHGASIIHHPVRTCCQQPSKMYHLCMKVTFDLDPDLYRTLKVEAARTDRSVRDVVAEAIAGWLEHQEESEDRASAAEALAEYQRDGGTAAAAFFEHLAAEARAEYGSERGSGS